MSGINRIQTKRESRYQGGQDENRMPGRELFFKDGDQAFISPIATGEEAQVDQAYSLKVVETAADIASKK